MGCSFQDGTRPGCFSRELGLVGEWTSGGLFPLVWGCPISKPHRILSEVFVLDLNLLFCFQMILSFTI